MSERYIEELERELTTAASKPLRLVAARIARPRATTLLASAGTAICLAAVAIVLQLHARTGPVPAPLPRPVGAQTLAGLRTRYDVLRRRQTAADRLPPIPLHLHVVPGSSRSLATLGGSERLFVFAARPGRSQRLMLCVLVDEQERHVGAGCGYETDDPLVSQETARYLVQLVPDVVARVRWKFLTASGSRLVRFATTRNNLVYTPLVVGQDNVQQATWYDHGGRLIKSFSAPPRGRQIVVNLVAAGSNTVAAGTALIRHLGARDLIDVRAAHLKKNNRRNSYALWLTGRRPPELLGFVNPSVKRDGRLRTGGVLPNNARIYDRLVLTLETSTKPNRPGRPVLTGPLHFG